MERRGARNVNQFRLTPEVCKDGHSRVCSTGLDTFGRRRRPAERSGSVMHHFTVENLQRAFQELSGSKAAGIDRVTKQQYGKELEENLRKLEERIRKGGWRPQPSREVLIPKLQGGTRPWRLAV